MTKELFGYEMPKGKDLEEVTKRLLKEPERIDPSLKNTPNLNSYIILEGREHGSYSYPDLLVAMQGSHHNKNWYQSHEELHKQDSFMLNPRQFFDFLELLKSGKAFDGRGIEIGKTRLNKVLEEIIGKNEIEEWLDAQFVVVDMKTCSSGWRINYDHRTIKGKLTPEKLELILYHSVESLEYEQVDLKSMDRQGLPTKKGKDIYFAGGLIVHAKAVLTFSSGNHLSGILSGNNDPEKSSLLRGVREAKIK